MKKHISLFVAVVILSSFTCIALPQKERMYGGKVLDASTGEGAGWATVALMTADSTIVCGTSADERGGYSLTAPAGSYILKASLIGYTDTSMKVEMDAGITSFPTISLQPDGKMLSGATVTERTKLFEIKIDKVVMNIRESAFAQGSNALELLKKAPGVTIDKDGNVKLNGKSVSLWIDGRPSNLDGKSLEALLRGTGSESIDRFELMEHPSSKYDASGQGGIINIRTRRNMMQGFSGSVGMGGGGMHFSDISVTQLQQSLWANVAYRTASTNTFLNVYESSMSDSPLKLRNDMKMENIGFLQHSESLMVGDSRNFNLKFGNDWFLGERDIFGVIASMPLYRNCHHTPSSHTEQYLGDILTQRSSSDITNGPSTFRQGSLNLNYTHVFDPARSAEITSNIDFFRNGSRDANLQADTIFMSSAPYVPVLSSKSMDSDNVYDIYSAKADYQTVLKGKLMLEAGAKWALSHTDNSSLEIFDATIEAPQDFVYREHVAAAYASLAGQLSPKLSFKAGLRGEYTNSFGDWKTSDTRTRRDYMDLFPTVFVGYRPGEKWGLNFSYTRRINRPSYHILNPSKVYLDSKTYTVGNPDILPMYNDDISIQATVGQHLSFALSYDHTSNDINQIPSFQTDGTQYLTWGNLGRRDMAIAGLSVSALPLSEWLQWTLSTYGIYINSTTGTVSDVVRSGFTSQLYTDFSFVMPANWRIDLDGYFSSPMVLGCYYTYWNWSTNIAAKKSFMDNRLSVTMRLDDIFNTSCSNLDILDFSGKGAITTIRQDFYSRILRIDLSWSFGKAQKPSRSRNVGNLEEMSRMGGSGSAIGK